MSQVVIKNPMPKILVYKEIFDSVASTLVQMLIFNPYLEPYVLDGKRSIVSEALFVSLLTTLIVAISVSKKIQKGRFNGEIPGFERGNNYLMKLPKKGWLLGLVLSLVTIPLGIFTFLLIFNFYGFESWSFYQFFWVKFVYASLLSKGLVKILILRNLQPDCAPGVRKR